MSVEGGGAVGDLITAALDVVSSHGRSDLAARIEPLRERLATAAPRVLVAGDFKQGKSSLTNALAGADVCAVEDDRSTATVTEVVVEGVEGGTVHLVIGSASEPLSALHMSAAMLESPADIGERWWSARVVVPLPVGGATMVAGAALVDLPGRHGATGGALLAAALPGVVAALFVSDAGAELSRAELAGLDALAATGFPVALVVPKIDFFPAWRKVADLDRSHLERRGLEVPVFAVSSSLERRAQVTGDDELDTEAGFAPLRAWLEAVTAATSADAVASVVDEVRVALAGVKATLEAAQGTPDEKGRTLEDLEERAERLHVMTGDRARWRRVVTDGIADLEPEGEHILRARLRTVRRDAEDALALGAPAEGWTRFSFWLSERTVTDVATGFAELGTEATSLALAAGDAFEDDEAEAVALAPLRPPALDPTTLIASTSQLDADKHGSDSRRQRVQRSVGRIDSVGVLEGLATVSLNPLSIVAGVLISRRAVKDSRTQAVDEERAAAVAAMRQYIEDAEFVVLREWRAAVRRLDRDLRDGYEQLAASLARSADEALAAARAVASDPDIAEGIERELAHIARLDEAAVAVVTGHG